MAKKSATIEDAEIEEQKSASTLSREREDKQVANLADNPENINHLRRMGRHVDAARMEARYTVALAAE